MEVKMILKKILYTLLFALILSALSLTGCSNPLQGDENTGTITINFGGGSPFAQSSSLASISGLPADDSGLPWPPTNEMLANMRYEIILTDNEQTIPYNVSGLGTITTPISAGHWNVRVVAYYDDQIYAIGTGIADVTAGQNIPIRIIMEQADPDESGSGDLSCHHNWSGWVVITDADFHNNDTNICSNGEKKRTCTVCEDTEVEAIPCLGTEGLNINSGVVLNIGTADVTALSLCIPDYCPNTDDPVIGIDDGAFADDTFVDSLPIESVRIDTNVTTVSGYLE
jgi:hypothetical protein